MNEEAVQNGMDEWQAAENEKIRLMATLSSEVDNLKMSRAEWRSRAECAEERIRGWVTRVEQTEMQRDAAMAENERLRKGIQDYLDGDYENPRQHRCMSDKGKCKHGVFWWEECGCCGDEHFANLLQATS